MDIKELEGNALSNGCYAKGALYQEDRIQYHPSDNTIELSGDFTIDELQKLVIHMKIYQKKLD